MKKEWKEKVKKEIEKKPKLYYWKQGNTYWVDKNWGDWSNCQEACKFFTKNYKFTKNKKTREAEWETDKEGHLVHDNDCKKFACSLGEIRTHDGKVHPADRLEAGKSIPGWLCPCVANVENSASDVCTPHYNHCRYKNEGKFKEGEKPELKEGELTKSKLREALINRQRKINKSLGIKMPEQYYENLYK